MEILTISTEYINLQQALKLAGLLNQGSDIKFYIEEELILVNDELTDKKRHKLYNNYLITIKSNDLQGFRTEEQLIQIQSIYEDENA